MASGSKTSSISPVGIAKKAVLFKMLYPAVERYVSQNSIRRNELLETCHNNNSIWYGEPEQPLEISRPREEEIKDFFEDYSYKYKPQRPFVCELEKCKLLGPHGIAMGEDGRLILETLDHGIQEFVRLPRYNRTRNTFIKHTLDNESSGQEPIVDDRIVPMICSENNYYHWVTEYLPKLRHIEDYQLKTNREVTLLLEPNHGSFVRESLTVAGFGSDKCISMDDLFSNRVAHLVVPIHRSHFFNHLSPIRSYYSPSLDDIQWVRERIWAGTEVGTPENDVRIFVSRQGASERKILNYNEFFEVLQGRGFESYKLEHFSFQEQVELFSRAEVIMGPIGAGLVNMIFSNDPLVIELLPRKKLESNAGIVPHFYFLSDMLDFEYEPILIEDEGDDLVVDIDEFRIRLDEIGL